MTDRSSPDHELDDAVYSNFDHVIDHDVAVALLGDPRPLWHKAGKQAAHMRNDLMLSRADAVLAFWDGESHGTKSVIAKARKRGLPVEVVRA